MYMYYIFYLNLKKNVYYVLWNVWYCEIVDFCFWLVIFIEMINVLEFLIFCIIFVCLYLLFLMINVNILVMNLVI